MLFLAARSELANQPENSRRTEPCQCLRRRHYSIALHRRQTIQRRGHLVLERLLHARQNATAPPRNHSARHRARLPVHRLSTLSINHQRTSQYV